MRSTQSSKDHPLKNADFTTKTPKKQSGAGTLTLRHKGGLVVEEPKENEKILFELSGSKMQGRYALIKIGCGQELAVL